MKAFASFVMAFFLFVASTFAEEFNSDFRRLRMGISLEPGISWMRPTTGKSDDGMYGTSSNGSSMAFGYGIMADYNFSSNYALATGLTVKMTGGKILADRVGPRPDDRFVEQAQFAYRLNYLEIPLGLKLRTNDISGFRFFGHAGVGLAINISRKADYQIVFVDENGQTAKVEGEREKVRGAFAISPLLLQMNLGLGTEYDLAHRLSGYVGVFFNNGFLPDVTNPKRYKMASYGQLPFSDGNVRLNNVTLKLGIFL